MRELRPREPRYGAGVQALQRSARARPRRGRRPPPPGGYDATLDEPRAFPPPARDFARETAAQVARITGAAMGGAGALQAVMGFAFSMRQLVFAGIATGVSGWLVAVGRMLGVYFYTL